MAETVLSFGVEKLRDLLVQESERFQGVEDQFTGLKSKVDKLRCFVEDADAQKHTNKTVRKTVEEIKEIVYDAEDIIKTFVLKKERRTTCGICNLVGRCFWIIVERRGLALDMEVISRRISTVISDMQGFGVHQGIVNETYSHPLQEAQRTTRQTFSSENETVLVGYEENLKKLVGYLVEEDSTSQVVSITGMGGLGKTTLAKKVFNHETVKNHFAGLAWVCVSQQCTRKYVWETILRKLMPECEVSMMTEDELQGKLFQVLEEQKVLIVLDDIWREGDWEIIKPIFPPGKKGLKILLTSRNEGVALRADPKCFTLKPDCLNREESWTLFRRTAFPNTTENNVDEELRVMGKQMLEHCGGLPLAVTLLGGLLAQKDTLADWERVYKNFKTQIVGGTSFNEGDISLVYDILYLSYEELPIYLKHCFLYLAHFPEDYEIEVEKLSYYWAADGVPRSRYYERASVRDVGDGYIEELVKRNMVMSERDGTTSRFETCQLHDMMREVCLLKAKEENFVQFVQGASTANPESPCKSRRLAVHRHDTKFHLKNPSLRSLLLIKAYLWEASALCFTRLQLMRVLDLSHAEFEREKLPSSIGKLIHLRYLSLYEARVSHLPSSMRNLKQLIYLNLCVHCRPYMPSLNLREGCELYMPNILKEMRELTYLCLPERLNDKVKLELGNLINVETLVNFSTKHGNVRDLQGMTRLETLSVLFSGGCSAETLSSSLSELKHLENLTIMDERDETLSSALNDMIGLDDNVYAPTNDEEGFVLECANLRQLELRIYIPRLPDEQHLPSHLTTLYVRECRLEEDPMPILEKLLHLKEVTFWEKSFCGRRMVCSRGGFPQLQKLLLLGLHEWEEWIVEEGSMLLLHTLVIIDCAKLKELPDGLRFITSLKDLSVFRMGEEWKEKLSEGGEDYYKVQHIPSVRITR